MLSLNWWASLFWRPGVNLLFPPECAACGGELAGEDEIPLCAECRQAFALRHPQGCPRCGDRKISARRGKGQCASCARHKVRFERAAYLGTYEQKLREAVLRLKHPGNEALAVALGEWSVCELSPTVTKWSPDLIAPIPMFWRRRLARGVNSPQLLAEVWSRRLRLPQAEGLLVRQRNTLPQADLLPEERFRNMRGAFRVSSRYRLWGAKILLVDDILTTGATCHEAALTLLQSGASAVYVVALARAG